MTLVPSRALSWLRVPLWGRPLYLWLACLAAVLVAVLWLRVPFLALVPAWLLSLVRPAARVPAPADRDDPAPAALDAHGAALETDRALAEVQAASAVREAEAVHRVEVTPIADLIREHNAERRGGR